MKKLKEILLVDDSKGANLLNKRLLESMDIVDKISTALNGQEALDYLLSENDRGEYPSPNLIFIDVNMPVLSGFQFMEKYEQLEEKHKTEKVIVMLTSSISKIDKEKAESFSSVKKLLFKPLTKEHVRQVITESFS